MDVAVDDGTVQLIVVVVIITLVVIAGGFVVAAWVLLALICATSAWQAKKENFYFWLAANFLALSAIYQKFLCAACCCCICSSTCFSACVCACVCVFFFGGTWRELAGNRESFRWCVRGGRAGRLVRERLFLYLGSLGQGVRMQHICGISRRSLTLAS